jgi:hypothetical protein
MSAGSVLKKELKRDKGADKNRPSGLSQQPDCPSIGIIPGDRRSSRRTELTHSRGHNSVYGHPTKMGHPRDTKRLRYLS